MKSQIVTSSCGFQMCIDFFGQLITQPRSMPVHILFFFLHPSSQVRADITDVTSYLPLQLSQRSTRPL